ncbi:hypothetical protein MKX03_027062, partial [Papaver bracteatum]
KNISTNKGLESLSCTREGLTEEDARKRLEIFGFMWNPFSWVLGAAAIMAITLSNGGNWQVFLGIITLLVFNSVISLIEDSKAGKAAADLKSRIAPKAMVLRDGWWNKEDAAVLVPGDIIRIKPGDIIPANVRLLKGDSVMIDMFDMSFPRDAYTEDFVSSGSTCTKGEIDAVVIATGGRTEFGEHTHPVDTTDQIGQYQKIFTAIQQFCICAVAVAMLIEIVLMYQIQQRAYGTLIDNLLVLLIGGIPIALPTVLSVIMLTGSHCLSRRFMFQRLGHLFQGAITKRMTVIEELAGMNVLFSDKTGTLTLNKPSVDKDLIEVLVEGESPSTVILMAAQASRIENQDAIDTALVESLGDVKKARAGIQEVHFLPFNPTAKRTALTYIDIEGKMHRVSKGAPEQILDLAHNKSSIERRVQAAVDKYAEKGLRALSVAYQEVPEGIKESLGGPWQFMGLLPLFDPPRHDSAETIKRALNLGVNIKMITGDPLALAKGTGRLLGMGTKNMHTLSSILGENTLHLLMARLREEADGFAEVSPVLEDKYKLVKCFQARKHICGITGDGVKDVCALNQADIGIAVADSTDAARRASDLVLTEPGLSVIINAVLTSRAIFHSMKSCMIYAVSVTIQTVLGFMLLAVIWRFDFSPFMVLVIAILNNGTIMTMARDNVKPSPLPDSWKLREILAMGIVLGSYLAAMTITFFWAAFKTEFFPTLFKVSSLQGTSQDNVGKVASAIYLQMSTISQALVFVTRSHRLSFVEPPGILLAAAFIVTQLIATLIAVYANWSFVEIQGIGWGWAGIIWLYNIVIYIHLDTIKIIARYALTALARQLEWVDSQMALYGSEDWRLKMSLHGHNVEFLQISYSYIGD